MRIINDITPNCDYLKDESQLRGKADIIYFCHSTEEVEELLTTCYKNNTPVTIQGALTGICGGAVPLGGVVLNVSEMNKILGIVFNEELNKYTIKVQSGLLLKDLNHFLKSKKIDTSSFDEESIKDSGAKLFYASVDKKNSDIFTSSSRSLAVVGIADNLSDAEKICEQALSHVKGDHIFIRHDIGTKDLINKRIEHMNKLRGK